MPHAVRVEPRDADRDTTSGDASNGHGRIAAVFGVEDG